MVTTTATSEAGEGAVMALITMLPPIKTVSRPVDSGLSHKNALERCIEHSRLWQANSDQLIAPNCNVSCKKKDFSSYMFCYGFGLLREKLKMMITGSNYFTITSEMVVQAEVATANYGSFHLAGDNCDPRSGGQIEIISYSMCHVDPTRTRELIEGVEEPEVVMLVETVTRGRGRSGGGNGHSFKSLFITKTLTSLLRLT
ncbi:unnamed protein product [Brassica rapa]|uniref:Uncharacterized protein n=1 Tax=Brassica campestris TaxID=3711 RepID=A0A3P6B8Z3_BRACM|nr:unnamed protein product [Brassica rapa]VDC97589.1 unnamed protein product [Brassica rapa]